MYFTMLFIGKPLTNANNRGENQGNVQTLHSVFLTEGKSLTYFSGPSVRWAMRDNMQALHMENPEKYEAPFRWHHSADNDGGYTFGSARVTSMEKADSKEASTCPDTGLFGYMLQAAGSGDNAEEGSPDKENNTKLRSCHVVSRFFSTTPSRGDIAFHQGIKGNGTGALYSVQEHLSRNYGYVTLNLTDVQNRFGKKMKKVLQHFFAALAEPFCIGGNHAAHASQFVTDMVMWVKHSGPGCGLQFAPYETASWTPDKPLDVEEIKRLALVMREDVSFGGTATGMSNVKTWEAICAAAGV